MTTWDDKPNDYEHAVAEIERLRAERDKQIERYETFVKAAQTSHENLRAERDALAKHIDQANQLDVSRIKEIERLRAERDALLATLKECADDLEAELEARYDKVKGHPAMKRRYDNDMVSVLAARAAIKAAEGG